MIRVACGWRCQFGPCHPSLHFKRIGELWSARVGEHYRALAIEVPLGLRWFWIGTHSEYDKFVD
jgi:hypothetical protein